MAASSSSRLPIIVLAVLLALAVAALALTLVFVGVLEEKKTCDVAALAADGGQVVSKQCTANCKLNIVETIPENVTYAPGSPVHKSTFDSWMAMLTAAKTSVDVGAFYWTLTETGSDWPSKEHGRLVYEKLRETAKRGVRIRIAQTKPSRSFPSTDSANLAKEGLAEVRSLDFRKLIGSGVLHSKFIVVDQKHLYTGSANLDWRALSQVKELGAEALDCSCLAEDLQKVFDTYWFLGQPGATIPDVWPASYGTNFTRNNLVDLTPKSTLGTFAYLSVAPPQFLGAGRESDVDAILDAITNAEKFVHVCVMDYAPTTLFTKNKVFWPVIDDALRAAAYDRGLEVRIMVSKWKSTKSTMWGWMHSLANINQSLANGGLLEVRVMEIDAVTPEQQEIPYARVNHNKYMVTDNTAYIGTSNWVADYFLTTAGVGLTVKAGAGQPTHPFATQLADVFTRDWSSKYATPLAHNE